MNPDQMQNELAVKSQYVRGLLRDIKSMNREPNATEVDMLQKSMNEIEALEAGLAKHKEGVARGASLLSQLDSAKAFEDAAKAGAPTPAGGKAYFGTVDGLGKSIADALTEGGRKSLVPSGTLDIATLIPGIVTKAANKKYIAELIYDSRPLNGAALQFLRQTVRNNQAAPVSDGAVKPTSIYSFIEETLPAQVLAHLSEGLPRRYLQDHSSLAGVLQSEMLHGLSLAVDDEIINGTGIAPSLEGLLNTSGVGAQVYDTSVLVTTRTALTGLQVLGVTPTGWVLNPVDWQAIDLSENVDGDLLNGSTFTEVGTQRLWGIPVVLSNVVTAGTAILGDWSGATLRQVGSVEMSWSEVSNSDDWSKNLVRLRTEGRFVHAVLRPDAFSVVELTEGA